jgi:very-short-patch-repair endonuclease
LDSFIKNIFQFKNNSNKIRDILSCLKDIDKIIVLDKIKGQMTNLEKNLFALCLRDIPPSKSNIAQKWEEIIRNSFYIHWIQKLELSMPNLKGFTSIEHDNIKSEMITLLRQKMDLVPKIIEQLFRSKYHTIKWNGFDGDGRRKNYNALNSFIHEVSKQRKRISVRQLVENFSNKGLFDLFPCWMCSPETVSNIFPLKASFDIVIFDEASQCKIERAIPSVMRGKRIIVAGDEKQLPPSNFFVTNVDDEAEDDEDLSIEDQQILESESLLIRAKSFLPGKRLNYHYRSNHHELIDFSNYAFYQSMLRVIPSNRIKTDSPIEFIKCKGIWRDRKNEDEAKQLVLLLKKLLKNNSKGQTFGIITFNSSQKEEIENRIDEETKKDPYFATLIDAEQNRYNKDEYIGLFVKNIENVQGDERDVIIFSISYANDDAGKFRYRFGPLNGPYGSNRLNVAISRAKEKIYLFCSFNPIDFKYEGSYDGPKLLGKYLSYCKAISDNNTKQAESILKSLLVSDSGAQTSLNYFDSDFEAEVAEELEKIGFEIKTQVGCNGYKIDIAIVNPKDKNKYLCGIECDGETYHSIRSVKDRDLYRQSVLEANGWKIIRVLSRDWWKDQDKEVKRIHREILSLIDSYKKDAPLKNNRVNTVTEKKKKLENLV